MLGLREDPEGGVSGELRFGGQDFPVHIEWWPTDGACRFFILRPPVHRAGPFRPCFMPYKDGWYWIHQGKRKPQSLDDALSHPREVLAWMHGEGKRPGGHQ
jgi:hypothetical protein